MPRSTALYDLYAQNLSLVKNFFPWTISQIPNDAFVCPICRRIMNREDAKQNLITLEHVPPKSIGGYPKTLTCKNCNNTAGNKLDATISKELELFEFLTGTTGTTLEGRYSLNDKNDLKLNAEIKFEHENILINGKPQITNPKDLQKVNNILNAEQIKSFRVEFPKHSYSKTYRNIALLRIAYLWIFSKFGYYYILFPQISQIQKQILEFDSNIISNYVILSDTFPDETLGVNVITRPRTHQSFLVVFDAKFNSFTKRYGVIMPGLSTNSLDVYSYNTKTNIEASHIANTASFTKYPLLAKELWLEYID